MNISVVIPALNEAGSLPGALRLLGRFLEGAGADLKEIIVVDDASTDGTAEAAESLAVPGLRAVRLPVDRGKGAAVRAGVLETTGDVVVVTDADGNYLHDRAGPFLDALRTGVDIVLASRAHPGSKWEVGPGAAWYIRRRRVMGRVFNGLVRLLFDLRARDTQTGLKFFRGDVARELFRDLEIEGFAYDVEILWRARRRGYRLRELPLVYVCPSARSKVTFWDPPRMALDLLRIRRFCQGRRPPSPP